ncbi:phage tail assembly chaperone [Brevibacillus laterosporus]|uniref:Phage portal protein n=1 Tax=Brevibacillus laterosporus TaxID=1465 RepID=A0AAP3DKM2_BRELA|nr:phage portal protein [Brevibacillus laterosporus]AYB39968.1 phage portal protein [Brevibacillus laterosporus]MBM7111630.1 Phage XkdN-like protein [Brevibacillus laterosporus]MCR8982596.1 phage portal protein [Brevibacillus laterosporus]MCZ0809752.1 phage portal protein [Brevibacillus laterosporus]MCZ0828346.1 phage portal protein [Brevibacillus laterosporus]
MSDLSVFFAENVNMNVTEEVFVSDKFKDKKGKVVKWKIKAISEEENKEVRKKASVRKKVKKNQYTSELDNELYNMELVLQSVVFPDLYNAELQKSYDVVGADNLIRKMLFPGEFANLLQEVIAINGYDKEVDEMADEIKN